jgi:hypothetical protein
MDFAKNVLISLTRFDAHGCVQVCVLAVRPVLPSHQKSTSATNSVELRFTSSSQAGFMLT